jgi:hypothetical protein
LEINRNLSQKKILLVLNFIILNNIIFFVIYKTKPIDFLLDTNTFAVVDPAPQINIILWLPALVLLKHVRKT